MSKRSLARKNTSITQNSRTLDLIPSDTDSHIGNALHVQDSVIGVRWCFSKAVADVIEHDDIRNPMLLIVVVNIAEGSEREMLRKLVPLTEMMVFVPFYRPGKNRILASIVYPKPGSAIKSVKKELLSINGSSYAESVFNYEDFTSLRLNWGSNFRSILDDKEDRPLITSIDFDVPAEFFAKEPAEWEKQWVNMFFETAPVDHCAFERRRIFAYTIQPVIVLVVGTIFLGIKYPITIFLTIVALFRGVVDFDWDDVKGNLLHPGTYRIKDLWYETKKDKTYWSYTKKNSSYGYYSLREKSILPWIRPTALSVYGLICLVFWLLGSYVLPFTILIAIIASVIVAAFVLLVLLGSLNSASVKLAREKRLQESVNTERSELSYLLCTTDTASLQPKIDALPKEKRTFKLRALDFKRGHCKPFAK